MKKSKSVITETDRNRTQDMSAVAEYNGEKSNRAKLVEFVGDDYDDTPVKDNSVAGRAGNFWYHYKWHTIIIAAILIIVGVGVSQMVRNASEKTDLSVVYAGPASIHSREAEDLKDVLSDILSVDLNSDGAKRVYLYSIRCLSADQIALIKEEAKKNGSDAGINEADNRKNYEAFSDLVFTGECGLMFLDGSLYNTVKDAGGLDKLTDALGFEPDRSFDGYGIRLCDIPAYEIYDELEVMPAETIVCLRSISTAGGVMISEREAKYNHTAGVRLLRDLLAVSEK
ncbi:MAG: hypothetical protein IJS45_09145 [Clostridia bacterium]|nr:hypothetical protein [Clostridia bacterium]